VILAILIIWQIATVVFDVPPYILPSPAAVAGAFGTWGGVIFSHTLSTLWVSLAGFGLAVIFGISLGVWVGISPLAYRALYPVLLGFNSIPKVALVPVLVIWFGIGAPPAIITAFLISFFPILVNVALGISALEPALADVLKVLGASRLEVLTKVAWPQSLPHLFASLKVAVSLALVGAVISETMASQTGIGYLLVSASSRFEVDLVFAALVAVAVLGIALYAFFAWLEAKTTSWARDS
jgi:NitT/TauT family transport system permease protein